jgi:hypothetical protein
MALSGHLSVLSLAELIEIFCNQRKTGRLKIEYSPAPGYFYIKEGELFDAILGPLHGSQAVYYALTLPRTSCFNFDPKILPSRHTIIDSWQLVILEGLRRVDEGIKFPDPFIDSKEPITSYQIDPDKPSLDSRNIHEQSVPSSLALMLDLTDLELDNTNFNQTEHKLQNIKQGMEPVLDIVRRRILYLLSRFKSAIKTKVFDRGLISINFKGEYRSFRSNKAHLKSNNGEPTSDQVNGSLIQHNNLGHKTRTPTINASSRYGESSTG